LYLNAVATELSTGAVHRAVTNVARITTIRRSVEQLSKHPHIGRAGRVERTRELVIPKLPYIVAYTVTMEEVQILAVVHTSRKWPESF
jgi:plasmid stabilization system protein ParE